MNQTASLIDIKSGQISRELFVSEDIYRQELERIFARCWLFLAHESQIPEAGDYFSTWMGEDPVLVVRQKDGGIKALLNSCRHRGTPVCRADCGKAMSFTCTYHGWTYDLSGKLVGVPHLEDGYRNRLDLSRWGLVEVAQVQSYKGLIFGAWDERAPSLPEYLGDMAWYLDALVDAAEGGTEVIGGVHKWVIPCNWKLAAEQFSGDAGHPPVTHASASMAEATVLGGVEVKTSDKPAEKPQGRPRVETRQFANANGHAVSFPILPPPAFIAARSHLPVVRDYYQAKIPDLVSRLGAERVYGPMTSAGNVFPNFSFLAGGWTIRTWHPRAPDTTEIWSWTLVDREMPAAVKDAIRRRVLLTFSPTGTHEQDDVHNWSQIQKTLRGAIARRYPFNYQLGLGHDSEYDDYPGTLTKAIHDFGARNFYRRYRELLDSR